MSTTTLQGFTAAQQELIAGHKRATIAACGKAGISQDEVRAERARLKRLKHQEKDSIQPAPIDSLTTRVPPRIEEQEEGEAAHKPTLTKRLGKYTVNEEWHQVWGKNARTHNLNLQLPFFQSIYKTEDLSKESWSTFITQLYHLSSFLEEESAKHKKLAAHPFLDRIACSQAALHDLKQLDLDTRTFIHVEAGTGENLEARERARAFIAKHGEEGFEWLLFTTLAQGFFGGRGVVERAMRIANQKEAPWFSGEVDRFDFKLFSYEMTAEERKELGQELMTVYGEKLAAMTEEQRNQAAQMLQESFLLHSEILASAGGEQASAKVLGQIRNTVFPPKPSTAQRCRSFCSRSMRDCCRPIGRFFAWISCQSRTPRRA